MAGGSPAPINREDTASHVNPTYDSDQDGVVDNAMALQGNTPSDLGVPSGVIQMWSGAATDIPQGYVLCDGNNGTPNLQDKFVVGAGNTYSVGGTGGEASHTLTTSELPSHSHSITIDTSGGSINVAGGSYSDGSTVSTNNAGGDSAHENRPPYYAVAYIMRV